MTASDPRAWLDRVEPDDALPAATTALRAVLNLHAPGEFRAFCRDCSKPYPCPTVTAITTALEDA
jgi:hypothetical protein